ncbi:hypothetical protein [Stieleria varia]|uniref:Secreted protein n=1 Tax=Stieleria varia TaxID=2528005 RepID=A0A5C5ZYA2_9BACT|nr:hypothetical protein [Stieleria varia]TWT91975.1 hypothetical protein Pla52n_64480 [Stieleria varia]
MFAQKSRVVALLACVAVGTLTTAETARADLAADSSFGFNWSGQPYVGGWVKNVGVFNYSQNGGRRVQLWFYYPSNGTWQMVMNQPIVDVPAGQTRAFLTTINPASVGPQPVPVLYITPAITDINPNNDLTFHTVWLGSY